MKKIMFFFSYGSVMLMLLHCGPSKSITFADKPTTTYEGHLRPVINTHCAPCHIPSSGGNQKSYDTYASVKTDIDEIIRRIELNPGEKGFMPHKKTEKLSDSIIQIFRSWRNEGLAKK